MLTRIASQMFDAVAAGAGAVARSLSDKLAERTSVADYDTFAHASAEVAIDGGTLYGAAGDDVAMRAMPPSNVTYQYDGPGGYTGWFHYNGADIKAKQFVHDRLPFNTDTTKPLTTRAIHTIAGGSTVNGPVAGAFGQTISLMKEGFGTAAAKGGEMDALYIVMRQDNRDGVPADGCGILIDVAAYDNIGFVGGIEGATTRFRKSDNQIATRLSYQIGCMDFATSTEIIYYGKAVASEIGYGIKLDCDLASGGFYSNYINCNNGNWDVFNINKNGEIRVGNDSGSSGVFLASDPSGTFSVRNNNQTSSLLSINQAGSLEALATLKAGDYIQFGTRTSAPSPVAGAVYRDSATGKLKACEDGATWRTITTT
ncbi:hypothetical protein FHT80_002800 [Rhizobium sp. BK226]|uniref:hypothetical protein n=1 Tax=Rhizobium sp. BK226 TaxID=2587075 RepID=UPI00161808E8|nr:hypothetical protein [Rhizobium sp. BK226]MBB4113474.1 hypothetical protein [Rhizobium sp. BK226]